MHKIIMWCFRRLNDIGQIISLVCAFFILAITLSWLELILKAQWAWLNFIKPVLNPILDFSSSIFPISISTFPAFDAKYVIAIIILLLLMLVSRLTIEQLVNLQERYQNSYIDYKLAKEKSFNQSLQKNIVNKEKKILKYMVLINTKLKKKFSHQELNINIDEQNQKMNKFLFEKTGVQHQAFNGGFLYYFDDFDKIDKVLEVLFKVLKSNTPLEYEICIQSGMDLDQLKKISELNQFGKITMCADTSFRYKCNNFHRYGTNCIGVYQKEEGTIELHEFQEIS